MKLQKNETNRAQIEDDQKLLELHLRDQQFYTRSLIEANSDAIMTTDPSGIITDINTQTEALTGCTRDNLIGTPFKNYVTDPARAEAIFNRVLIEKKVTDHELTVRARNGKETVVSYHAATFYDRDGRLQGVFTAARDVTERKRMDLILQEKNSELERAKWVAEEAKSTAEIANQAKSAFLASMSHEIRTPINAMLGFSQLMMRDPELTPAQAKHLQIINRSGEHLLALVNDILEISKIEAGRLTLHLAAFDLRRMLDEIDTLFRLRTEEKNLSFQVEHTGALPERLVCDENKLFQIFTNLIGNAIKFTSQGGICVRTRITGGSGSAVRLLAEIEDTGGGIAEEEIGKLFKPFEQAECGRKSQTGTGLGLAISRSFARLMGGDISVSSQLGKGSVFRFEVDAGTVPEGSAEKNSEPRYVDTLLPGQPVFRVLIADDKEDNRTLMVKMVKKPGFEIRDVSNGEEAVQETERWHPHLILMDMRMPVMDGYEAIKQIRAGMDGKKIKIISITASTFSADRKKAIEAGADDFLGKPFREQILFEKIKALLAVDYIYHDAPLTRSPAPEDEPDLLKKKVAALPDSLLLPLQDATLSADLDRMLDLIGKIENVDVAIAGRLRHLAENFEYQTLLENISKEKGTLK